MLPNRAKVQIWSWTSIDFLCQVNEDLDLGHFQFHLVLGRRPKNLKHIHLIAHEDLALGHLPTNVSDWASGIST